MSQLINIAGKVFGYLTVIERNLTPQIGRKRTKWLCHCKCGNIVSVDATDLRNGHTKSCGCYHKEMASKFLSEIKSHSDNYHLSKTKSYRCWHAMMQRCYNPKMKFYSYYGGRGIQMCKRWHKYKYFLLDMGEPSDKQTLDRIDSDGHYCKNNCRWATMSQQNNNRRSCKYIYVQKKRYSMKEFVEKYSLSMYYVRALYNRGLSGDKILAILSNNKPYIGPLTNL